MQVKSITLNPDNTTITATISHEGTEVEYEVQREQFEDWLTEGTDNVTFENDSATMEEYWDHMTVNDTPHKEHIHAFLRTNSGKGDKLRIEKALAMQKLMSYLSMDGLNALKEYNQAYHNYMEYYSA